MGIKAPYPPSPYPPKGPYDFMLLGQEASGLGDVRERFLDN